MESKKTEFQSFLTICEKRFEEYVSSHFQSFGEIFRRYLPVLMILWGIVLFLDGYSSNHKFNSTVYFSLWLVIFGFVVYAREYHRKKKDEGISGLICEGKRKYGEYPDVIKYLEQLQSSVDMEEDRDKKLNKISKIVFWVPLALYGAKAIFHFLVEENALKF